MFEGINFIIRQWNLFPKIQVQGHCQIIRKCKIRVLIFEPLFLSEVKKRLFLTSWFLANRWSILRYTNGDWLRPYSGQIDACYAHKDILRLRQYTEFSNSIPFIQAFCHIFELNVSLHNWVCSFKIVSHFTRPKSALIFGV